MNISVPSTPILSTPADRRNALEHADAVVPVNEVWKTPLSSTPGDLQIVPRTPYERFKTPSEHFPGFPGPTPDQTVPKNVSSFQRATIIEVYVNPREHSISNRQKLSLNALAEKLSFNDPQEPSIRPRIAQERNELPVRNNMESKKSLENGKPTAKVKNTKKRKTKLGKSPNDPDYDAWCQKKSQNFWAKYDSD